MLYFKIKDYSEFKDIFGTKNSPRGTIQNKILLAFWKSRFQRNPYEAASLCRNMTDMYKVVMDCLTNPIGQTDLSGLHLVRIKIKDNIFNFYSSKYTTEGIGKGRRRQKLRCRRKLRLREIEELLDQRQTVQFRKQKGRRSLGTC